VLFHPDGRFADLSIAKGDFVETHKNDLALALKKAYDQMYGVGKDGVKSPYVISSEIWEGDQFTYRIRWAM
jgi:hypothetical protein